MTEPLSPNDLQAALKMLRESADWYATEAAAYDRLAASTGREVFPIRARECRAQERYYRAAAETLEVVGRAKRETSPNCRGCSCFGWHGQASDIPVCQVTGDHLMTEEAMADVRPERCPLPVLVLGGGR